MKGERLWALGGLLLVLAFYVVNTVVANRGVPQLCTEFHSWFHAQSLPAAYELTLRPSWAALRALHQNLPYPPGYTLESALILRAIGKHWLAMVLIHNTAYLLILLISTFAVGRRIQDEKTGALAALLLACYPPVYGSYQLYSMDFAAMCLAAAAIALLYGSDFFRRAGWSAACGLVCGWGMLVKAPFAAFIAGPLLYAGWRVLVAARQRDFAPLRNGLRCAAILTAVMLPYQLHRPPLGPTLMQPPDLDAIRLVTVGLWENLLTPPFFLALLAGGWSFSRRAGAGARFVLASWILVPVAIVLLMPQTQSPRYLLPMLPALALVSATWLRQLLDRRFGPLLPAAVAFVGAAHYYAITYGIGPGRGEPAAPGGFKYFNARPDTNPTRRAMAAEGTALQDIVSALRESIAPLSSRRPVRILALVEQTPDFYHPIMDLALWISDTGLRCTCQPLYADPSIPESIARSLDRTEFILLASRWYMPDLLDARFVPFLRTAGFDPPPDIPASSATDQRKWRAGLRQWQAIRSRLRPRGEIFSRNDLRLSLYEILPAAEKP